MVHLILGLNALLALIGKNKKRLIIPFAGLFVFAALRYDFGNDYSSYLRWFNYIKSTGHSPFKTQILFTYLNEISPSFLFMIAFTSAVFLVSVYFLIRNNVSDEFVGISFLIFVINPYLFLMNLSSIRQSIATSLFILSIYFAKNKKLILYVILICCAALFHKSAIVLLPVFLIANEKPVKNWHIVAVVCVILFLLFSPSKVNELTSMFLEYFNDKTYTAYINGSNWETNSLRATLLSSLYLVYIFINIKKLRGSTLLYSKLYSIAIIFAIMAYRIPMATRFQMYFDLFSLVALPGIIETNLKNEKSDRISILINVYAFPLLLLVIYILRYYSFFVNPLWEKFTEYKTIFGAFK